MYDAMSCPISNSSAEMNEDNDCTVRAIAATTGIDYRTVHQVCARHGRRNRRGMHPRQWEAAIEELGFDLIERQSPGKTIRTCSRYLPRGRKFIIHVARHVAGWDGEKIRDWADGRQHRVMRLLEIVPKTEQPAAAPTVSVPATGEYWSNVIVVKRKMLEPLLRNVMKTDYQIMTPPPRVRRDKWASEQRIEAGVVGVIELKGDAAVAERKKTGKRGQVFMIFGYK